MRCPGAQRTAECSAASAWQAAAVLAQRCAPGKLRCNLVGCSAKAAEGRGLPEIMLQLWLECLPGPGGLHSCDRLHPKRHAQRQQS